MAVLVRRVSQLYKMQLYGRSLENPVCVFGDMLGAAYYSCSYYQVPMVGTSRGTR